MKFHTMFTIIKNKKTEPNGFKWFKFKSFKIPSLFLDELWLETDILLLLLLLFTLPFSV
jgi:hypothetical protein